MHAVLVHSPLVGPDTWAPVAGVLEARGHCAAVADLVDATPGPPYWRRHVGAIVSAAPADGPVVLVAHSGAGPLLPVAAAALAIPPQGAVHVDAMLPAAAGAPSRLELLTARTPEFAAALLSELEAGGVFPTWDEDALVDLVPDPDARRTLVAGLQPRGLDFFTEPIPVPEPALPSTYLQLSPAYDADAAEAAERGWLVDRMEAGHFHLLVDPDGVADRIVDLATRVAAGA